MRAAFDACNDVNVTFIPLPVETLSGWHPEAEEQIIRLARNMALHSGSQESHAIKHFFQKLGVLLQRGKAVLFLSRKPNCPT
jgi:hypothetical protein